MREAEIGFIKKARGDCFTAFAMTVKVAWKLVLCPSLSNPPILIETPVQSKTH